MSEQLTDEQVAYWRRVLPGMFGVYARLMSREQIQVVRDKLQSAIERTVKQSASLEPLPIVADVMAALKEQT